MVIDILDRCRVAQARDARAAFEALLAAQCHFMIEDEAQPFGMIERSALGVRLHLLEALRHAVKAERVELIDRGMVQQDRPFQWK